MTLTHLNMETETVFELSNTPEGVRTAAEEQQRVRSAGSFLSASLKLCRNKQTKIKSHFVETKLEFRRSNVTSGVYRQKPVICISD